MEQDGEIGIILNLTPSYPRDEKNEEDVKAAQSLMLSSIVRSLIQL